MSSMPCEFWKAILLSVRVFIFSQMEKLPRTARRMAPKRTRSKSPAKGRKTKPLPEPIDDSSDSSSDSSDSSDEMGGRHKPAASLRAGPHGSKPRASDGAQAPADAAPAVAQARQRSRSRSASPPRRPFTVPTSESTVLLYVEPVGGLCDDMGGPGCDPYFKALGVMENVARFANRRPTGLGTDIQRFEMVVKGTPNWKNGDHRNKTGTAAYTKPGRNKYLVFDKAILEGKSEHDVELLRNGPPRPPLPPRRKTRTFWAAMTVSRLQELGYTNSVKLLGKFGEFQRERFAAERRQADIDEMWDNRVS